MSPDCGTRPTKVLPDWKHEVPENARTESLAHARTAERARVENLFLQHSVREAEYVDIPKKVRIANMYWLSAVDHSMQAGLGVGLQGFVAASPPGPLGPSESRYFVRASEVDASREWDPPDRQRACILDSESGQRRLECPLQLDENGHSVKRTLHISLDQGSIGRAGALYMYTVLQVRGAYWWDLWHRTWNDTRWAISEAGLRGVFLDCAVVWNFSSGPWAGCAFLGALVGARNEIRRLFDHRMPLFAVYYESIALDAGLESADMGSEAHMQTVWQWLMQSPAVSKKGDRMKFGRWFSWFNQAGKKLSSWSAYAFFLAYIGMRNRFWADVHDSPILGLSRADAAHLIMEEDQAIVEDGDGAAEEAAPAEEAPAGVEQSNAELEKKRKSAPQTLKLAMGIVSDCRTRMLCSAMVSIAQPLRDSFGAWQTMSKTQSGHVELRKMLATWETDKLIFRIICRLQDPKVLTDIRLADPNEEPSEAEVQDDISVCERAFRFCLALGGKRGLNSLHHSGSLPGVFARLLHHDREVVAATLTWLRDLWDGLQQVEAESRKSKLAARTLASMVWTNLVWVRELLVGLREANFTQVPSDVRFAIEDALRGLLTTEINENSFNLFRSVSHKNERRQLGRTARWKALVESSLLRENDRTDITVLVIAAPAEKLTKGLFECDAVPFSCGSEKLDGLSSKAGATPSPFNEDLGNLVLQACVYFA